MEASRSLKIVGQTQENALVSLIMVKNTQREVLLSQLVFIEALE